MGTVRSLREAAACVHAVVSDADELRSDYRRMLQAQRTELLRILQRAYSATTPLLESKIAWIAFTIDPAWEALGVEQPERDQQNNAQLHFLRLVIATTPGNKSARDKAGKYARALDTLRSEDCPAGDVAAEIKARTLEALARSKRQDGGRVVRAKKGRDTSARISPPVPEDRTASRDSMPRERKTPNHSRENPTAEVRGVPVIELEDSVCGGLLMSAKTDRAFRQMDGQHAAITGYIEVINDVVIITASSVRAAR